MLQQFDSIDGIYANLAAVSGEKLKKNLQEHRLQVEQNLRDLTDGHLPDVVIDATGNSNSMASAFGLITHAGRLVFVGITTEEVRFRHPIFHKPEGTLLCSRNALSADFARIVKLIEDGRIDTNPWITHRTAFEDMIEVFPSYTKPETGVIKAVVEVGL